MCCLVSTQSGKLCAVCPSNTGMCAVVFGANNGSVSLLAVDLEGQRGRFF